MLIKIGNADPNIVDNDNVTPLHLVAIKGNEEHREAMTKLLVSNIVHQSETPNSSVRFMSKLDWNLDRP